MTAYVDELVANGKIEDVQANLNFDMVASPNFVRFVYDGDLSDSAPPPGGAPDGSGQIEGLFNARGPPSFAVCWLSRFDLSASGRASRTPE